VVPGTSPYQGSILPATITIAVLQHCSNCTVIPKHSHQPEDTEVLTFISRGPPVKIPKCETRPMTEPAVLTLELRSCLFDSSPWRDRWPRLQFTHTGSEAAVASSGTYSRTSDHERLYCVMPMDQVDGVDSKLKPTLNRSEDVNHANCGCWNGRSGLFDRTLHQRRDYTRCSAFVSSCKLLETPSLPMMRFLIHSKRC